MLHHEKTAFDLFWTQPMKQILLSEILYVRAYVFLFFQAMQQKISEHTKIYLARQFLYIWRKGCFWIVHVVPKLRTVFQKVF